MMVLSMWSVAAPGGGRICAIVPGGTPHARLCDDDPLWRDPEVQHHWIMSIDEQRSRLRPRIKFWAA
jgi:hypothetical protein